MTPGSIVAAWSWGTTAVATIMSQRSLKATDSADLPGWAGGKRISTAAALRAARVQRRHLTADDVEVAQTR